MSVWVVLPAPPVKPEPVKVADVSIVVSDSLAEKMEKDIALEYGFRENDRLSVVAKKLDIADINTWKKYLKLEVNNRQLDEKSLRQLDISPYQALLAHQSLVFGINEMNSVAEVARNFNIPIKKLKELLELDPLDRSSDNYSLQLVEKTPEQVLASIADFHNDIITYGSSIIFVGMLVVFISLAISSIIISQLVHLNREQKPKDIIKISKTGKVTAPDVLNKGIIVAAITALHIHIQSIEERRRLLLTFKRTPVNMWRATKIQSMPNREFSRKRS